MFSRRALFSPLSLCRCSALSPSIPGPRKPWWPADRTAAPRVAPAHQSRARPGRSVSVASVLALVVRVSVSAASGAIWAARSIASAVAEPSSTARSVRTKSAPYGARVSMDRNGT
uniref:Uncharacterized protein n=1 Tax=Rhodopseudomonas palustris (strain BisA53) TaxID=316055 RepID=Q07I93_RHOP5